MAFYMRDFTSEEKFDICTKQVYYISRYIEFFLKIFNKYKEKGANGDKRK